MRLGLQRNEDLTCRSRTSWEVSISVSRRMTLIVRDFRQREQGGTDRQAIPLDRIHGDCEPELGIFLEGLNPAAG